MNRISTLLLAAAVLGWSPATGLAQAPKSITPDLARLTDGKYAQVFNRALTVASEEGRTLARLDARTGDGGVLLEGVQLADGVIEGDPQLIHARNPNGFTPLHAAALYGQRGTAEYLADKGADLNAVVGVIRTNLAAGRTAEQMVRDDVLKAYKPQYSRLAFLTLIR
jgi:hypothetical protein